MDRKMCVLIYSQYSAACKQLIEYISSLPYDIVQLTGMTLLSADCNVVRKKLISKGIQIVPCLQIQYFDGTTMILKNDDIYKFISSVLAATGFTNGKKQVTFAPVDKVIEKESVNDEFDTKIVDKKQVMATAMAMQKNREDDIQATQKPNRTILQVPIIESEKSE